MSALTEDLKLIENLEYLRANAFEFTLTVNPHAGCHDHVDAYLEDDCDDDWVSRDQREEAYRTGHFVRGQLYPNGSVTFFTLNGTKIEDVVAGLADICRTEQARFRGNGMDPKASSAFEARELKE